jgi:hypothetical protein
MNNNTVYESISLTDFWKRKDSLPIISQQITRKTIALGQVRILQEQ